jgi:DnaK suppressor protein
MDTAVAALLEAKQAELAASLENLRRPASEPGTQPQYGKRIGDHTTEAIEALTRGGTAAQLERMAREVARALDKVTDGTYGRCDACGRPIGKERLEALPWAVVCVDCKVAGVKMEDGGRVPRR